MQSHQSVSENVVTFRPIRAVVHEPRPLAADLPMIDGEPIQDDVRVGEPRWVPTPEEIKAECEQIRREWSDKERAERGAGPGRIDADYGRVARFGSMRE